MVNWAKKPCNIPCLRIPLHGYVVENHNTNNTFCLKFYTNVEKLSGREIMSFNLDAFSLLLFNHLPSMPQTDCQIKHMPYGHSYLIAQIG